ncbi:linker for activation of T-cells family member 2 isoform X3 [Tupaia chinensis]|uniref:linker for activation of T-cells family member 2 isoform X3 n=1 Tax=Tupaia chinensis TaxID=246437 RepID=UPI000FFBA3FF|nr:linker for activation of T-cells family member 2 isoform X3 [Tupaia chinensis]
MEPHAAADMSTDTGLLWPGTALLLLLLGAAAGLCVRCSRPGAKRPEKIYERRSLQENQHSFAVARTYSLVRQPWPGPLIEASLDEKATRKDKLLHFSPSLDESASPRYQNLGKGSQQGSDAAYMSAFLARYPIATDYYNWGQFPKPPKDDDDTNSYENVLICTQRPTESEQIQREAPPSPTGSPEEDSGEPDYVNKDVEGQEA